jgi:hypothetical protein
MAQFFAGLNREIQDILEYKDYANITRCCCWGCYNTTSPIHWSWSLTYFWTARKHLLATVVTASYMDSNLGVLLLHGKITTSTLRRVQPHVDSLSASR